MNWSELTAALLTLAGILADIALILLIICRFERYFDPLSTAQTKKLRTLLDHWN